MSGFSLKHVIMPEL